MSDLTIGLIGLGACVALWMASRVKSYLSTQIGQQQQPQQWAPVPTQQQTSTSGFTQKDDELDLAAFRRLQARGKKLNDSAYDTHLEGVGIHFFGVKEKQVDPKE